MQYKPTKFYFVVYNFMHNSCTCNLLGAMVVTLVGMNIEWGHLGKGTIQITEQIAPLMGVK